MRDSLTRALARLQRTFAEFTPGQKAVAVVGGAALLLAGVLLFRWAAAPSYAPLYSNLAASDASAVIEELDSRGVPYQLTNGGNTILVPRDQVYATRIGLSGEGLPTSGQGGYSLLDNQGLSTSQFQEQTSFKRAMEGELSATIKSIDGVESAVVHLAMPPKQIFADQQDPTTASVLVRTRAGATLNPEQVQAIVNLVSSSVDGLKEERVTVADATGRVLSAAGGTGGGAHTQTQQVEDFQNRLNSQVQALLDRVLGPGNSAVQVTANLSFDKTVSETTRYFGPADIALSETESNESLEGGGVPGGAAGGVVGVDGQTEVGAGAGEGSSYLKSTRTSDNAVNKTVERREAAPGGVESLHVGIVLDSAALLAATPAADPGKVEDLVASALGIDQRRGDTIEVSSLAFDRTAEEAAAEALAASEAADDRAALLAMVRNGGLVLLVVAVLLVAWLQARRRARARSEATEYVVEQLRREALERQAPPPALDAPAMLALDAAEAGESAELRNEIAALVERQPEDVAALLRGWLVERP